MKLISATTILLISSSGVANAALPPGYQEFMHCPPGSCSLFIEHDKGFAGPASAYYKCYDERTDQTTDAVWTGQYTEIKAPEGWIQDPGECEPQMSDPTTSLNFDKPGGLCTTDSDCRTKIRSAEPLGAVGPRLCGCYAASRQLPFDETEGQTSFRRARCRPGACDRFEAYCPLASNDNGMAECALRPIDTSSTLSSEDSPRSRQKPRKQTRSTTSTSTSSDESPPSNPIKKKRRPAYLLSATSASATSDDSSTGIVSPTPAPPAPVQAVAEM
mmetsp:Transcript_10339/g.15582  ORF Transcript_10339/g.15582 Transcript_10339/m.15582 type:complete len:273 (-) Transcript_10339:88-906(-)